MQGLRCWNGDAGTASVVSALSSKTEFWMRIRRIGRMLGQQLNGNDWLVNGND
jgi:hypothetical protein